MLFAILRASAFVDLAGRTEESGASRLPVWLVDESFMCVPVLFDFVVIAVRPFSSFASPSESGPAGGGKGDSFQGGTVRVAVPRQPSGTRVSERQNGTGGIAL